jgi:hypothetical protein
VNVPALGTRIELWSFSRGIPLFVVRFVGMSASLPGVSSPAGSVGWFHEIAAVSPASTAALEAVAAAVPPHDGEVAYVAAAARHLTVLCDGGGAARQQPSKQFMKVRPVGE